jgi:hypothetical protein
MREWLRERRAGLRELSGHGERSPKSKNDFGRVSTSNVIASTINKWTIFNK